MSLIKLNKDHWYFKRNRSRILQTKTEKKIHYYFIRLFDYQVEWSPVPPHQDMVYSLPNGSLLFYPFSAEKYRHEIHSTVYRQDIKFRTFLNDKSFCYFLNFFLAFFLFRRFSQNIQIACNNLLFVIIFRSFAFNQKV